MAGIDLSYNHVSVTGRIMNEPQFSHEVYGEGFYQCIVEVPRLSESADELPITISERLTDIHFAPGTWVTVEGQLRSYNNFDGQRNKLILTIFVKEIKILELEDEAKITSHNEIELKGFICKDPIYRVTPFGREISDILLAVNRAYGKSDYIPCIAWGRNARFCGNLTTGEKISVTGRVQSRLYQKKINEEQVEERKAYEVSVSKIEIISDTENNQTFDNEPI